MAAINENDQENERSITGALKGWTMIGLTLVFVGLYAAALIGWLRPMTDVTTIARLEPIILVIIGYYFGRLPSQQNEKTLKDEIDRQTKKADAAQHIKEQTQIEREIMEEKIKNAKVALRPEIFATSINGLHTNSNQGGAAPSESERPGLLNRSVETVRRILDS